MSENGRTELSRVATVLHGHPELRVEWFSDRSRESIPIAGASGMVALTPRDVPRVQSMRFARPAKGL